MRRLLVYYLPVAVLFCAVFPGDALAWGPGVHMVTGNWILQNLAFLPPLPAAFLMRYPGRFLHGCLSADIFLGKGSTPKKGHSHNWESAFALLRAADTPQKTAYAHGYLAHLAADVVAHNVYVPALLPAAPAGGRVGHVYLEAQADRMLSWDSRDAVGVFHERGSGSGAGLLRSSMRQNPVSFWLKTRLFETGIAASGSRLWRGSLRFFDALGSGCAQGEALEKMLVFSTRAIFDVLEKGEASRVLTLDPVGSAALLKAGRERGRRKRARKAGEAARQPGPRSGEQKAAPGLNLELPPVLRGFPPVCSACPWSLAGRGFRLRPRVTGPGI